MSFRNPTKETPFERNSLNQRSQKVIQNKRSYKGDSKKKKGHFKASQKQRHGEGSSGSVSPRNRRERKRSCNVSESEVVKHIFIEKRKEVRISSSEDDDGFQWREERNVIISSSSEASKQYIGRKTRTEQGFQHPATYFEQDQLIVQNREKNRRNYRKQILADPEFANEILSVNNRLDSQSDKKFYETKMYLLNHFNELKKIKERQTKLLMEKNKKRGSLMEKIKQLGKKIDRLGDRVAVLKGDSPS